MIWWVICENRLRIGFRNEFLRFTSENKVDLDELYILKFSFKNSLESEWGMSHSISHRIFPQDFPIRISHKIFSTRIARKNFLQDFPTTISHRIFPQDFSTGFSCKIFPRQFPARFSRNDFLQQFPARISQAGS